VDELEELRAFIIVTITHTITYIHTYIHTLFT
jgi:hypothetical protein